MQETVKIMETDAELRSCFNVIQQLRPHINEDNFLEQIRRLQLNFDYNLAAVIHNEMVKAVAGYRITESLAWGKYFYVDDFITDEASRRQGNANILWNWLMRQAKENDCEQFHLDSGVHRHNAHRFYLKGGLDITCHHFQMPIN